MYFRRSRAKDRIAHLVRCNGRAVLGAEEKPPKAKMMQSLQAITRAISTINRGRRFGAGRGSMRCSSLKAFAGQSSKDSSAG